MPEVKIIKEMDDPLCTRISAGGNEEMGHYIVYRGDISEVRTILRILLKELETRAV